MPVQPSRRVIIGASGAASLAALLAAAGWPMAALAQRRRGPFGLPIPAELQSLLPAGATDALTIVEGLMALEQEADVRRLPQSVLQMLSSGNIPTDPDALYSVALPRLVALIDRATSARRDGGLGNRAAELLSRLHGGEHQVPDALRFTSGDVASGAIDLNFPTPEPPVDTTVMEPPIVEVPDVDVPDVAAPEIAGPAPGPAAPRRSTRYADLSAEYPLYFNSLSVRDERRTTVEWYLTMVRQSRRRYEGVSARTGVPWFFVGATHGLEASFNFRGHLHNGDFPLSARTRQVPAGRPTVWLPPSDWESSAVDAMRLMGFAGQSDWSLARTLYRLEAYNGFGYRSRGVPTPYLWSFSNHYERGKFVADGRWNPSARSQQCGAAVMLKLLVEAGDVRFA
jgi:lysozyme family protein